MIIHKIFSPNGSRYAKSSDDSDSKEDINSVDKDLEALFNCLQGRVRFGPGTSGNDGENMAGKFLTITTNAVANTETTFTHSMGSIPVGYIVIGQDKAGSLYQLSGTGTAWTNSTLSLKCSVASVQFKLFLLM